MKNLFLITIPFLFALNSFANFYPERQNSSELDQCDLALNNTDFHFYRVLNTENKAGEKSNSHLMLEVNSCTCEPLIGDSIPPELVSILPDLTIECDESVPNDLPSFIDNCDNDLSLTLEELVSGDECELVIERTWTATDDCGNSSSTTQIITIVDTTSPVFENSILPDIFLECDEDISSLIVSASDNCDTDVTVTYDDFIFTGGCSLTIERVWTATDDCGNSSNAIQYIILTDSTEPLFTFVPANITIDCTSEVPFELATAIDNCSELIVTHQDVMTGTCPAEIVRTFTAIDDCGNASVATQIITLTEGNKPSCLTDFDSNNITDGADFAIFLGNFGIICEEEVCPTDLNFSGETDGADFAIFLGNFGLVCN